MVEVSCDLEFPENSPLPAPLDDLARVVAGVPGTISLGQCNTPDVAETPEPGASCINSSTCLYGCSRHLRPWSDRGNLRLEFLKAPFYQRREIPLCQCKRW